ncbi:MAG: ABC transporter permease [Phycisphaerae bacterium]|nr:ABC transporter permease [Phycisphaerae bacterium]
MTSIWAVARHMVSEAIRMKIAMFFICLLALLIFGLPFVARGDGTVSGAIQAFLVYSLSAVSLLMALLTLFMSRSLSDELVQRQIFFLMTKPLPRWQYVLGKWFGIVLFDALLLLLAGAGICGMAHYIAVSQPPRDALDRQKLTDQVFAARHQAAVELPTKLFERAARERYERRKEEGYYGSRGDVNEKEEIAKLRMEEEQSWRTVNPGGTREFLFQNVRCDRSADKTIQIRYKAMATNYPPDEIVRSYWLIGDPEKVQPYQMLRRDAHDRFHTFSVPAGTVAEDHTLRIYFLNYVLSADQQPILVDLDHPYEQVRPFVIRLEPTTPVEVMFGVGSFEGNLVRVLALILFKLMFLAALGLAASTVFSFPVAILVSLTVYVLAEFRGFIGESIQYLGAEGLEGMFQAGFGLILRVILFVIPNFPSFDAVNTFVDGRNVTLMWVLQGLGMLGVVQTGIVLLAACLMFHFREVSEVSI